jgi:hypothetical protein
MKLLLTLIILVFSIHASAVVEIKGGYSWLMSKPKELNAVNGGLEDIEAFDEGFTGDILLNASMMPVNLGARYEKFNYDHRNSAGQNKVEYERISAILGKRFLDSTFFLGTVATIGLSNEFKDKVNQYKASSSLSGSLGLDMGVKLGFLMFGVEGGYLVAPLGNLKDSTGGTVLNAGQPIKVDLSGGYARGLVGFNF